MEWQALALFCCFLMFLTPKVREIAFLAGLLYCFYDNYWLEFLALLVLGVFMLMDTRNVYSDGGYETNEQAERRKALERSHIQREHLRTRYEDTNRDPAAVDDIPEYSLEQVYWNTFHRNVYT
jgi:membrane protein implicated in regulation of membrane protease activity